MLSTTPLPQEKNPHSCLKYFQITPRLPFKLHGQIWSTFQVRCIPARELQKWTFWCFISTALKTTPVKSCDWIRPLLFLCQHMVLQVKYSSPKLMFLLCKGPHQLFSSLQIPNMELVVFWESSSWDPWATTTLLRTRGPTGHNTSNAPCLCFCSDFVTLHYPISTQRPLSSKSFPMCSITFWNDMNPLVKGQYSQWFSDQVKMAHFLIEDF